MMIMGKPKDPLKFARAIRNLQVDEDFDILFLHMAEERRRLLERLTVTPDELIVRQLQGAVMMLGDILSVCEHPPEQA